MKSAHARFLIATLICFLVFSSAPAGQTTDSFNIVQLELKINSLIKDSGAETVAVAFYDLAGRKTLFINPDVSFHAASTMKVPVMMEIYRQALERKLTLDERITIKSDFVSIADGSRYSISPEDDSEGSLYKRIGEKETIRKLVRLMIANSSNLATNLLIERVTAARVMSLMKRLGAPNMKVLRGVEDGKAFEKGLNNTATARDLLTLMRAIAEGRIVSREACKQMVNVMLAQRFNEGIPAGVPRTARVAHKTGSITKVNHDAGIVFPRDRKPYVIVVLTRGIGEPQRAHKLIADISAAVFEYISASPSH